MIRSILGAGTFAAAIGAAYAGPEISVFGGATFLEEEIDDTAVALDVAGVGTVLSGARIENELDAGFVAGGSLGWRWEPDGLPIFSVIFEGEGAFRSTQDDDLSELIAALDGTFAVDNDRFDIISFGPNVRFKATLPIGVYAYGGGGIGVAIQNVGDGSDAGVYGQGMVGAGLRIFKTLEVGLEYRAFATRREFNVGGDVIQVDVDTFSNEILGRVSLSF